MRGGHSENGEETADAAPADRFATVTGHGAAEAWHRGGARVADAEALTRALWPRRAPRAVILAGGRGRRLEPYTSVLPKPLMPIGNRSILEIIVEQLADHGITDITFAVGYLSHLIRAVFDNLSEPRAEIRYVQENEALGTAGPLSLIDGLDDTFLVMNGDVLTTIDYLDMFEAHRRNDGVMTVATHERTIKIDYGVVHLGSGDDGIPSVAAWAEKPEVRSHVSMGVYMCEPKVLEYIPAGKALDVPQLVERLLEAGSPVHAYPYDGTWFDIGRHDDYARAVEAWDDGRLQLEGRRTTANHSI